MAPLDLTLGDLEKSRSFRYWVVEEWYVVNIFPSSIWLNLDVTLSWLYSLLADVFFRFPGGLSCLTLPCLHGLVSFLTAFNYLMCSAFEWYNGYWLLVYFKVSTVIIIIIIIISCGQCYMCYPFKIPNQHNLPPKAPHTHTHTPKKNTGKSIYVYVVSLHVLCMIIMHHKTCKIATCVILL